MKKSVELRKKLNDLEKEIKSVLDSAKAENRSLNEAEQTNFNTKFDEAEGLKTEITNAERVEEFEARMAANQGVNVPNVVTRSTEKYSLMGHIDAIKRGKVTGVFAEAQAEGERQLTEAGIAINSNAAYIPSNYRSFSVTGDSGAKGGNLVETNKGSIIEALYEGSLLDKVGATKMLSLVGNVDLPKLGRVVSTWVGENATVSDSDANIGQIELRPNRLATRLPISNQLLIQSSQSVEASLRKEIERSIQKELDEKFIANLLAATDTQAVINGTNGLALTVEQVQKFVELAGKAEVDIEFAKYLINYDVWSSLKALPKAVGSDKFILENGLIDNMPFVLSNRVPSNLEKGTSGETLSAMFYGDFSSTIVAGWGSAIEILVDPFSNAAKGETVLNIGTYWDIKDKHYEGKVVSKDIVA
ncbi:HK97 family phage major capsid protein [Algoriphagus sp. 4150]|uniref:phage major capsid protein n=1 Tax=Algoriphagus sp. 4150 TaxID=2817756 RepID=UPI00285B00EE|nr:phage major capsid protein [Algoriphagus sp. 4150]MDR7130694.1 HK97 family phage major capsid protein [Algoriphagus sp. 4150]